MPEAKPGKKLNPKRMPIREADPVTGATAIQGVYAGGGASVVHAMAAGKRAASAIHTYLVQNGIARAQAAA